MAAVSLFYFFHAEKAEAEKRMVEIVNYVKVQCSTYTHYNESSESKSLLRAIESARQMSTNIDMETENGGQLSREFLKENLQTPLGGRYPCSGYRGKDRSANTA